MDPVFCRTAPVRQEEPRGQSLDNRSQLAPLPRVMFQRRERFKVCVLWKLHGKKEIGMKGKKKTRKDWCLALIFTALHLTSEVRVIVSFFVTTPP